MGLDFMTILLWLFFNELRNVKLGSLPAQRAIHNQNWLDQVPRLICVRSMATSPNLAF